MPDGILGFRTVHLTVSGLVLRFCAVIVSILPFAVLPFIPGGLSVRFVETKPSTSTHEYLSVGPPSAEHVNVKVSFTNPVKKAAVYRVEGETLTFLGGAGKTHRQESS